MPAQIEAWQITERDHFRERLESFVDVVFGLSLSLSAASLGDPGHASSLNDLLGFAFTFAAISAFWVFTHRVLTRAFVVNRASVGAIFITLCGVALFPTALSGLTGGRGVTSSVLLRYDIVFAAIMGGLAFVGLDGFVRSGVSWERSRRRVVWGTALRQAFASVYLVVHGSFLVQLPNFSRWGYVVLAIIIPASRLIPVPTKRPRRSATAEGTRSGTD